MPSSVSQVVQWLVVSVWYRGRLSGCNRRKSHCKALCAVLWRGLYNCIDDIKATVSACMEAVLQQGKIKALPPQQMQGKRKTRSLLTGWNASYLLALKSAEKNQKKNKIQDNIMCNAPLNTPFGGFVENVM